jgi:hypothetical protein
MGVPQPVFGNATKRAGDANDLTCSLLVERPLFGRCQAGDGRPPALLDEADKLWENRSRSIVTVGAGPPDPRTDRAVADRTVRRSPFQQCDRASG